MPIKTSSEYFSSYYLSSTLTYPTSAFCFYLSVWLCMVFPADIKSRPFQAQPRLVTDTTKEISTEFFVAEQDEKIKNYHTWVEKTLGKINKGRTYYINEHVFILANPSIQDSLKKSDYYDQKERGLLIMDSKECIFIEKGSRLLIPDSLLTLQYMTDIQNTRLKLNIPEFTLRVYRYDRLVDSFFVRVGKNETKYLAMAGRELDLRTKTGSGQIVAVNKKPIFTNPVDNKKYKGTYRDDGVLTKLPNIPWLETEINGIRNGQMIHPTTNLGTIGKAVSNGCIGLREKDAWAIYFYAPVGTKIDILYQLTVKDKEGNELLLEDIYEGYKKHDTKGNSLSALKKRKKQTLCYCGSNE